MERLEEITHPKPLSDFLYGTFNRFRGDHPWVGGHDVRPKSIGREMFEGYLSFGDFVKRYGLQRSEGVLLRYLSQLYKTLSQTIPDQVKTDAVWDMLGYFRALIERTDTSLLDEWEALLHPEVRYERPEVKERALEEAKAYELMHDPKAFRARLRAEMYQLVRALSEQNWEEAAWGVRQPPEDASPEETERWAWPPERFEQALAPFFEEYGELLFTPEVRQAHWTRLVETGERTWEISQVLLDPQEDNLWAIEGEIDLSDPRGIDGPLVRVRRIGP